MTRAFGMTDGCGAAAGARCALSALIAVFALVVCACMAPAAYADSGTVYSCSVHPVYKHPVSGKIEDSGGSSSAATGQAMVESCVSKQGMMEVTDAGNCYLTIRLSLIDLTSGHTFQVQDWGASGWKTPALGVTATGSDANGTTNDVCIELPSRRGIVRVSMYVDSMGRDVVFYAYADGLTEGAPAGFTPTIVTGASAGGTAEVASAAAPAAQASAAAASDAAPADSGEPSEASEGEPADSADASGVSSTSSASSASSASGDAGEDASEGDAGAGESSAASDLAAESGTSSAQGLSLSTAPDSSEVEDASGVSAEAPTVPVNLLTIAATVVVSGIVLMIVAAAIVYVFRRNWARWGGSDPDDYSWEYRDV